eukprot:5801819-Pyramimonas_sp.AAC.3
MVVGAGGLGPLGDGENAGEGPLVEVIGPDHVVLVLAGVLADDQDVVPGHHGQVVGVGDAVDVAHVGRAGVEMPLGTAHERLHRGPQAGHLVIRHL